MSNYMLNCTQGHTIFTPNINTLQPEGGLIQIVSKKRKIEININDQVILMNQLGVKERRNEEKKDWYILQNKGKIKSKADSKIATYKQLSPAEQNEQERAKRKGDSPVEFFIHDFDVVFTDSFDTNPFLDDYTYSLHGVYNYTQPHRHFGRRYTNLEDFDYSTLVKEQLYASRTVFGRLFYSLPTENQLEFLQFAIQEFKTTNFSSIPIIDGVRFLNDYSKRFTKLGKILKETYSMLETNFSDIVEVEDIGFEYQQTIRERNKEPRIENIGDKISKQVQLFDEAFKFESDIAETIELVIDDTQKASEERFNEKFKSKQWPIKIDL